MRILFLVAFAANLVLAALSPLFLPERVAIHFGLGGSPDNWAPAWINALLFAGLDVLLFVSLYWSPSLIFACPDRWINLPNKPYWLSSERRPEAKARVARLMWEFGAVLFLFLLTAFVLVIEANLADPVRLNEMRFLPALALFLIYTAAWLVRFMLAFRIPGASGRKAP